jgi:hypothetical protein
MASHLSQSKSQHPTITFRTVHSLPSAPYLLAQLILLTPGWLWSSCADLGAGLAALWVRNVLSTVLSTIIFRVLSYIPLNLCINGMFSLRTLAHFKIPPLPSSTPPPFLTCFFLSIITMCLNTVLIHFINFFFHYGVKCTKGGILVYWTSILD